MLHNILLGNKKLIPSKGRLKYQQNELWLDFLIYKIVENRKTEDLGNVLIMNFDSIKPKLFISANNPCNVQNEALDLLKTKCDISIYPGEQCPRETFLKEAKGKHVLLVLVRDKIDSQLLDNAGPQLKCVVTASIGYDHIDVNECKKRGVVVINTPGLSTCTVAELAIGLLLACARRIVESSRAIRDGEWTDDRDFDWMYGVEIFQSTIGIFGFGRIGQSLAERLGAFAPARILYTDILEIPEAQSLGAERVTFEYLLSQSDFIFACSPLTPFTRYIFDEKAFEKMKSSAIFINVSRGLVVKQEALRSALINKKILAAGLDVLEEEPIPLDDPLVKLENCVITPHRGGGTVACRARIMLRCAENDLKLLSGEIVEDQVM